MVILFLFLLIWAYLKSLFTNSKGFYSFPAPNNILCVNIFLPLGEKRAYIMAGSPAEVAYSNLKSTKVPP